jgi:hypothetical protein
MGGFTAEAPGDRCFGAKEMRSSGAVGRGAEWDRP